MSDFQKQFKEIIRGNARIMDMLRAVRSVGIPDWYIAAGAVRNLVWDVLSGFDDRAPLRDVDVVFFNPNDLSEEYEEAIRSKLRAAMPDVPWTVVNQARVHLWYKRRFGVDLPRPYVSVEDGIDTWQISATSIGVRLESDDSLTLYAPYGLEDLFNFVVRPNNKNPQHQSGEKLITEKKWRDRWPNIVIARNE